MSKLVIVESPAKARTIAGYLGRDYVVESSIGHIRDLPQSAADTPAVRPSRRWKWARSSSFAMGARSVSGGVASEALIEPFLIGKSAAPDEPPVRSDAPTSSLPTELVC